MITGKIEFNDEQNGIYAWYEINSPDRGKNRPKDYIIGEIRKDGVVVSKLFGTYFGYLDFDGERYWDIRRMQNFDMMCADLTKEALPSDCRNRQDSIKLFEGDIDVAQQNKEHLEVRQRADRKLREAAEHRRKQGGAKIDYTVYPGHPLNTLTH